MATPCIIIKEIGTGKVIETMKVETEIARTAARTFKGLLMRMDRDRFVADDSQLEKHFGDAYTDALSALVR
jgi:hypothetical protein